MAAVVPVHVKNSLSGVFVLRLRIILGLQLLVCATTIVFAEVEFSGLTIDENNRALFSATVDAPKYREYTSSFTATIAESARKITQLTFYPERIAYLPGSGQLQIHNRFGLFRSDDNLENIQPVEGFDSFARGSDIRIGKINPVQISPDGRYMMRFETTSSAYGNLVLIRFSDRKQSVVSQNVELSLDALPVSWSPEADFFIYQKAGKLYYFSIDQYESSRLLSEDFRNIGKGQISSIHWGSENELYYISGILVYQISGAEFFTRSLYQEFLSIGRIVGKIPFAFDPNFDRFWISPDGTQILLDKGDRNIFLYFLRTNDYANTVNTIELPYLYLPQNARIGEVLWTVDGIVTLLIEGSFQGQWRTSVSRLDLSSKQDSYSFQRLEDEGILKMVLSPDERYVALLFEDEVKLYDYANWDEIQNIKHAGLHHILFVNSDEIILAGRETTVLHNLDDGSSKFIAFSQSDAVGFSGSNGEILLENAGIAKAYDTETGRWFERDNFTIASVQISTGQYRVYLEKLNSGSYQNMIMIRQIARRGESLGTTSLFDPPVKSYEAFPAQEEQVNFTTFRHGSRIRRREVSLVFNAIDSATGLASILETLDDYGIRTTFFLNGDFMRRYPGAVQEIAGSGHEVGSLFNMYFDMSDARFQVTSEFIRQGLAKNEDDYFANTGEELGLLWHAPYYYLSPEIIAASKSMNYTYVGRDMDSFDWVPTREDNGISRLYYPSARLIERIMEQKKPGSIISMTVGAPGDDSPDSGREDYLFRNLDILINNLLERGYAMVPVTTLMDHAR